MRGLRESFRRESKPWGHASDSGLDEGISIDGYFRHLGAGSQHFDGSERAAGSERRDNNNLQLEFFPFADCFQLGDERLVSANRLENGHWRFDIAYQPDGASLVVLSIRAEIEGGYPGKGADGFINGSTD